MIFLLRLVQYVLEGDIAGSGQIVTIKPTQKGDLAYASREPTDPVEKNKVIKIAEDNLQIAMPEEKKPTVFDRAVKSVNSNTRK